MGSAEAGAAVRRALKDVALALPHLTGLAHAVRVVEDPRVETLGVFRSGRLLVNPAWFLALDRPTARFAVAHELLHLALRTHERAAGSDPVLFNLAHDAIINDLLVDTLGGPPPAGGLWLPEARHRAAEDVVAELRRDIAEFPGIYDAWQSIGRETGPRASETALGAALRAVGLVPPASVAVGGIEPAHVLSDAVEARWFPGDDPGEATAARETVRVTSARADRIEAWTTRLGPAFRAAAAHPGDEEEEEGIRAVEALPTSYRAPWEAALQRWLETTAAGSRSYARPSRRGADRSDVVLVGRRHEERRLHVVLDASQSMSRAFASVLGVIAAFCEQADVAVVRVLQCDTRVTRDEDLTPADFQALTVAGIGGSDLSPALRRLAADPAVEAAVVITDGWVEYPASPMPYAVLWALTDIHAGFEPAYGQTVEPLPPRSPAHARRRRRLEPAGPDQ